MEILTAASLKRVGEPIQFDLSETLKPVPFGGRTVQFSDALHVWGEYVFDGKAFTVSGTVQTAVRTRCARCDEPMDETVSCSFSERFVRPSERKDEESYTFEGERLVLGDMVLDNLLLQLPIISVCREDCKGLCPVCGVNRNRTICTCGEPAKPNPFAALEQYKV